MKTIKVLLLDNNPVNRKIIKKKLNDFVEIEVVGECADRSLVLDFIDPKLVDVVLMDGSIAREDGVETVKLIKFHFPKVNVVVISSVVWTDYIDQMVGAGAVFLDKWEVTFNQLQQSIISVFEDGVNEKIV
jgi:DNA-binding NarL/FixJ family response regulator